MDYVIVEQELLPLVETFVVRPVNYLSDHSQIAAWFDFKLGINKHTHGTCGNTEQNLKSTNKLPKQFIWQTDSKQKFQNALNTESVLNMVSRFNITHFENTEEGVSHALKAINEIFLEAAKKSLKVKNGNYRRRRVPVNN